nr:type II toxin-antitoxin system HipA family toxin [Luteimonas salinisoli]
MINGRLAGRAFADRRGHPGFVYDEAWRNSRDAIPLSLSLPLANKQPDSDAVAAVLWGFLPDNEHILQRWASQFHVSPRNPLALLGRVGEDCAGAAQFVRTERVDDVLDGGPGEVEWLDEASVAERLRQVRRDAGATRRQDDIGQFSLPGVQPKIALHRNDGRWGIPQGRTPTTHILKPPTGAYAGYVENEHFCLTLARSLQLSACESAILHFEDEITICVRRYDREYQAERWWRVHQEDFCQALGVMPQRKYQKQGGPSPAQIGEVLHQYSAQPRVDRENFLLVLVFNWLIGGSDAHAKNYSLLLGAGGAARLAPFYDISSALPYPEIDRRKLKMAMKIGSHYRWHDINVRDWLALGSELGFSNDDVREVLALVGASIADFAAMVAAGMRQEGIGHPIVDTLVDSISESARRCMKMLSASSGARSE